jgi:adenine-specific DNA-methyltransferase
MSGKEAWEWFQNNYPAISNHLFPFREKAQERGDKGDFWWELRACDYYKEFAKVKIMYQKFQVKPCFIYDETGLYCNDSMWVIPSNDKVLLGILNSKIGWWLISKYCTAIQNGFQLIWKYFGQIPIPDTKGEGAESITAIVDKILSIKKSDPFASTTSHEAEIDRLVYELYGLTEEEIRIVEGGTKRADGEG